MLSSCFCVILQRFTKSVLPRPMGRHPNFGVLLLWVDLILLVSTNTAYTAYAYWPWRNTVLYLWKSLPKSCEIVQRSSSAPNRGCLPCPSDKEMIEGTLSKLIFSYELLQWQWHRRGNGGSSDNGSRSRFQRRDWKVTFDEGYNRGSKLWQELQPLTRVTIFGCNLWLQSLARVSIFGCNLWLQSLVAIFDEGYNLGSKLWQGLNLWLQALERVELASHISPGLMPKYQFLVPSYPVSKKDRTLMLSWMIPFPAEKNFWTKVQFGKPETQRWHSDVVHPQNRADCDFCTCFWKSIDIRRSCWCCRCYGR